MNLSQNIRIAFGFIAILWAVYFADLVLLIDLRQFGIIPRHVVGSGGIAAAPFLHVDSQHLIANSGVLFVLLMVSFSYSRSLALKAITFIWILSGGMVWLFGKGGVVHIGASGIIFGLIGFLMCLGLFRRDWKALLISIVITILYGGALYSLLIYIPGTSWSGHVFGFLAGMLAAWWLRCAGRRPARAPPKKRPV
jgi:membrane associated rhomboid family serine protease